MTRLRLPPVLLFLCCCTTLPQPPVVLSDAKRAPISLGIVPGMQIGRTRALVSAPGIQTTAVENTFEGSEGGVASLLSEPRFALNGRLSERLQVGGHVGWLMNGVEARWVPNGLEADLPVAITAGAQAAPVLGSSLPWDVRVMMSVHPVWGRIAPMLGAGISAGKRRYGLVLPAGPFASYGTDQQVPALLPVYRSETRVEAMFGLGLRLGALRPAIAVQPFLTIAHGDPRAGTCLRCEEGVRLEGFTSSWGVALTLTLQVSGRGPSP